MATLNARKGLLDGSSRGAETSLSLRDIHPSHAHTGNFSVSARYLHTTSPRPRTDLSPASPNRNATTAPQPASPSGSTPRRIQGTTPSWKYVDPPSSPSTCRPVSLNSVSVMYSTSRRSTAAPTSTWSRLSDRRVAPCIPSIPIALRAAPRGADVFPNPHRGRVRLLPCTPASSWCARSGSGCSCCCSTLHATMALSCPYYMSLARPSLQCFTVYAVLLDHRFPECIRIVGLCVVGGASRGG